MAAVAGIKLAGLRGRIFDDRLRRIREANHLWFANHLFGDSDMLSRGGCGLRNIAMQRRGARHGEL